MYLRLTSADVCNGTDRNSCYSVNSRLIGEHVEARILDRIEFWYGQKKVEELPRLRGRSKHRWITGTSLNGWVRKPGAFENYRYQGDLFPTSRFRMAYDASGNDARPGGKGILEDSLTVGPGRRNAGRRSVARVAESKD